MTSNNCPPGLDQVNVSFLPGNTKQTKRLPLVISPRWNTSVEFVTSFCIENREWLDQQLLQYGAVLFRGFDLESAAAMEKTMKAYQPKLSNEYRGTSPRTLQDGTEFVFSAAEVPVNYPIAQHIEMSFLPAPPKQLFFGCIKPSASAGGETALCHFGSVYEELPEDLRTKFVTKGLRYERRHCKVGAAFSYDVSDMLGWPMLFGTSEKSEVERICRAEGIPCEWEGDTFVSISHSDATQLHPVHNTPIWFNHSQVFHESTFPAELWLAVKRVKDYRLFFHMIMVSIFCFIQYMLLGRQMSLHCRFGDNTKITNKEMAVVRKTIHNNMVFFRWDKGDLLLLDNLSTSHGRQPTFDKGRKIVVAWAEAWTKTNLHKDPSVVSVPMTTVVEEDEASIISEPCMENPQERTPEATMTTQESKTLGEAVLKTFPRDTQGSFVAKEAVRVLQGMVDQQSSHKRVSSQPAFTESAFWTNKKAV